MAELSAAQRADFTDAFSKLDRDGDGTVDTEELDTALQSLGQNPTDIELLDLINIVRGCGLQTMDLQAFLEEMARQVKATSRAPRMGKEIKEEFQIFDRNADGLISSGELREVMGMLGERINEDKAVEMIRKFDTDSDGWVNCSEFTEMMSKGEDVAAKWAVNIKGPLDLQHHLPWQPASVTAAATAGGFAVTILASLLGWAACRRRRRACQPSGLLDARSLSMSDGAEAE